MAYGYSSAGYTSQNYLPAEPITVVPAATRIPPMRYLTIVFATSILLLVFAIRHLVIHHVENLIDESNEFVSE